jgi:pyridinium-3,5-bisthiocarboxylic acid mononucleotide nickel chelatase
MPYLRLGYRMTNDDSAELRSSTPDLPSDRVLLLEPFSGISGDMLLGALLDLGVPLEKVVDGLRCLPVHGYRLSAEVVDRAGIRATKFDVILDDELPDAVEGHNHPHDEHEHDQGHGPDPAGQAHQRYSDIRRMIEESELAGGVKQGALKTFQLLAEAEGRVHETNPDDVEFHEVGAVDSIVDIVGAMIALEELAPARVYSTPVNVGRGTVKVQHGIYPVPAPATEGLLRGIPTFSNEIDGELTTPTGAALLASIVGKFGYRPALCIEMTGYGAGARNPRRSANVLRVSVASEPASHPAGLLEDEVVVLESAIDDMSPEVFGYLQELLLNAGALDFYLVPAQMKKGRPGTLLTVLCAPVDSSRIASLVLGETTTLGVRLTRAHRAILPRDTVSVETVYGTVRVKRAYLPDGNVRCSPEYEDCRRLARERVVPLVEIFAAASTAAAKVCGGSPGSP